VAYTLQAHPVAVRDSRSTRAKKQAARRP